MSEFWKNFGRPFKEFGQSFVKGFSSAGSKAATSLVGDAFALPGQFIGQAFDRSAMRFQNELIRGNMAYQAQLNQQAVDRQNEYNSPAAVAARARAAGVDPSVLLGGSPGSPGVSGASAGASLSSPSSRGSSPQDFFSRAFTGQQLKNLESQGNLTDQQAAAAKASADKDTAEAEHIRQQTDDIRWYNKNVRNLDVLLKKAGLTKAQADARIAELEKLYQEYLSADGDIESSQRFEMFKAQLDKIRAEVGDLNASAALKTEQAETEDTEQALNSLEKEHRNEYYSLIRSAQKVKNLYDLADTIVTLTTGMPIGGTVWQYLGAVANRVAFNDQASDSLKSILDALERQITGEKIPAEIVEQIKNSTEPEQFKSAIEKLINEIDKENSDHRFGIK